MSTLIPPYRFSKENTKVKRFWDELENGQLKTTQCQDCKTMHWPPKSFCTSCYSDKIDWVDLPSTGTLLTWTKVTAPPEGFSKEGYTVGIVSLTNSDLRVFGQMTKSDNELKQGMNVKLEIIEDDSKFRYFQFTVVN